MRTPRKEKNLQGYTIGKVSCVLGFVKCPCSSNVWSRGQVLIFVKSHCTGVNLVEED